MVLINSVSKPLARMGKMYHLESAMHQSNLVASLKDLLTKESFVDVTLSCGLSSDGDRQIIKAHKVVLAASSSYFQQVSFKCSTNHVPSLFLLI